MNALYVLRAFERETFKGYIGPTGKLYRDPSKAAHLSKVRALAAARIFNSKPEMTKRCAGVDYVALDDATAARKIDNPGETTMTYDSKAAQIISHETPFITEDDPHRFSMDASDLGLRPGEWPQAIETTLGNRMTFIAHRKEVRDGELQWIDYRQANGCVWLRIFND